MWQCVLGEGRIQPGLSGATGGAQELMLVTLHPGPTKATDVLAQDPLSQRKAGQYREGHNHALHPTEGH